MLLSVFFGAVPIGKVKVCFFFRTEHLDVSNPLDNRNEKLKRNSSPRPRESIKSFFP
jgi:hypothetical protein